MKVISFSIDQMRIEGWLRSSLTHALSWSIQLSNSSRAVGQLVQVVGALAVEDAAAADDDPRAVHQVQGLLLVEAAELLAPEAPGVLAVGPPLGDGRLGVLAAVARACNRPRAARARR